MTLLEYSKQMRDAIDAGDLDQASRLAVLRMDCLARGEAPTPAVLAAGAEAVGKLAVLTQRLRSQSLRLRAVAESCQTVCVGDNIDLVL